MCGMGWVGVMSNPNLPLDIYIFRYTENLVMVFYLPSSAVSTCTGAGGRRNIFNSNTTKPFRGYVERADSLLGSGEYSEDQKVTLSHCGSPRNWSLVFRNLGRTGDCGLGF